MATLTEAVISMHMYLDQVGPDLRAWPCVNVRDLLAKTWPVQRRPPTLKIFAASYKQGPPLFIKSLPHSLDIIELHDSRVPSDQVLRTLF